MNVSLGLPAGDAWADGRLISGDDLVAIAQTAESAGFAAVYVTDHPFPPARWLTTGGHATLDPFVALSFVASATSTIRLHTHLLVAGYRNPFIVAKAASSLDFLSSGRVILGMGAGYLKGEFAALGAEFEGRGAMFDEAIDAIKAAWSGEEVDFLGGVVGGSPGAGGFSAAGNIMLPRPSQTPGPPIWIGGNSRSAIRRAVERAEGWCPMPSPAKASSFLGTPGIESIPELATRIDFARECAASIGRTEPLTICFTPTWGSMPAIAMPDVEATLESASELNRIGVSWLPLSLPGSSRPELLDNIASFGAQVVAPLLSLG